MREVLVLSSYRSPAIRPFGKSMELLLNSVANDLELDFKHVWYDAYGRYKTEDTLVVFLMPPARYIEAQSFIVKQPGAKFVLWNVEPFSYKDPEDAERNERKYIERQADLKELAEGKHNIDQLWLHSRRQATFLATDICKFLPIGFHECWSPRVAALRLKKTKDRRFAFLGHVTTLRKTFLKVLRSNMDTNCIQYVRPKLLVHSTARSRRPVDTANSLYQFRIGLDIQSNRFCTEDVRWHRLATYTAADLCIISNVKLEPYGFNHLEHYFYFHNSLDCALGMNRLLSDWDLVAKLQKNMKDKFEKDFHMTRLFEERIGEL